MAGKPLTWNVDLARQLHNQGHSPTVIAERCGTTKDAVIHQIKRYWGRPRHIYAIGQISWDPGLGRSLFDKGLSIKEIADQCHTTKSAIIGYAKRHWPERAGDAQRYIKHFPERDLDAPKVPKARPLAPGERTLPDLPSLRG